jgi:Glycosyl transferases group 1
VTGSRGGSTAGPRSGRRLSLLWRLLRGEGARGVAERLRDRLAEARRRRSFRPATAPPPGFSCAVLNLASAPPAPRLGGAQAQLLWRLAAEAERRPVALLYPETAGGGGFRLELQQGQDRRALQFPAPGTDAAQTTPVAAPAIPAATPVIPAAAPAIPAAAPAIPAAAPVIPAAAPAMPATALADPGLGPAVLWAAGLCGASAVQVEGLAGMPLATLLELRQSGLRLVLAVHDFAAFCPRPNLLEALPPPAAPRFCHYSREPLRCARCLDRDFPGLPPGYQEERRELARRLLASADAVVYPSPFLARAHGELFGAAGADAARVIAPALPASAGKRAGVGVPPAPPATTGAPTPASEPAAPPRGPLPPARGRRPLRHVAWVGAVQPHKGALVFETAVKLLAAAGHRFRLGAYGGGDADVLARWRRLPGVRVRGYYRAGSLPERLRHDRVDLALLLSIVPESYSLALDECAAARVPVVAFDLGAPAERIAAAGSGLLLAAALADEPAAAGGALATLLGDLLDGRLELPPPPAVPPPPPRSPAAAAAAWMELYGDLGLAAPPER